MLSYIHWPFRYFEIDLPEQITSTNLTIITHGVHDDTDGWVAEFAAHVSASTDTEVIADTIIREGKVQVTSEYRENKRDEKKKKIISILNSN